jgi:uncharacterized protein (TIGR02466 family)
MSVKTLFPSLIYSTKFSKPFASKINKDLIADARALRKIDIPGLEWSKKNYVGGYTSYGSVDDLHQRFPPFQELKEAIDKHVKKYIKALNVDLLGRRVQMTTCWINMMPSMVHHSLHLHPLCFISGTYYVQVPKGSGSLKLEDPRMGLLMAAPPRKKADYFHVIEPVAGQLVLWESWMRHEVTANKGKGERMSVSFNYEWI